jgi:hypothetical protein
MLAISISRKFEFFQRFSPPKGHEATRHWHEPEAKHWFLPLEKRISRTLVRKDEHHQARSVAVPVRATTQA